MSDYAAGLIAISLLQPQGPDRRDGSDGGGAIFPDDSGADHAAGDGGGGGDGGGASCGGGCGGSG